MRKNFLFALVGIVAMLTSCNQEEGVGGLATSKTTSFNVSVDGGVKTRAEVTDLTRYVMEVYKGATATGTPVSHKEQATGVFTDVVLDNAQEYIVLFWADYGTPSTDGTNNAANEYNATDLKAARVAADKQPAKAAYSGVSKFTVGTTAESAYTQVTLTHAVAQVNFVQTESLTSATNTLTVSYPESYSLNVGDNAVTKIDGAITHTFAYNQKTAGTLGTSYIIAATSTPKTVMEVTATLNSETAIPVANVPFERNYKTNISGAYSSKYGTVLTVTCNDTWNGDTNKPFPSYAVGDLYPNTTNPIGVVFWVNQNDATKGKIVSLDEEANMNWSTENIATNAKDKDDGASNTNTIKNLSSYSAEKYPPVAWCLNKGTGWYLPSTGELGLLYSAKVTVNNSLSGLSSKGATPFNYNLYWASNEYDDTNARFVYFDVEGSSPVEKQTEYKSSIGVRAVLAF